MARPSKVDLCMFCGEAPCTCRAKTKAPPKPRAPRKQATAPIAESNARSIPSSSSSSREKADVTAAMKAAAKVKHHGATVKEDHDSDDETSMILADPEMTAAIQALAPILHPTELKRFERVLAAEPDHRQRAAAWKQRLQNG